LAHICPDEVEDSLKGRDKILGDVVFGIKVKLRVVEECLWRHTSVNESRSRCTCNDDIWDAFAVLGLQTRVVQHALGADHRPGGESAAFTVGAQSDLPSETEVLN